MDTQPDFWGTYLPGLVIYMFGSGTAGILPTGAALQDIPKALLGVANATHSTIRRLCASIGLAVMAALLGEGSDQALLDGAKSVFVMVAIVHLCLVPFMRGTATPCGWPKPAQDDVEDRVGGFFGRRPQRR